MQSTMPQEAFPNEIFVRRETHVVKYIINENETIGGGKYYHLAERPVSEFIHFENTLYFEDNVSTTTEVFREEIKAKEAAHYYAKSKVQSIEKELDALYKA